MEVKQRGFLLGSMPSPIGGPHWEARAPSVSENFSVFFPPAHQGQGTDQRLPRLQWPG